VAYVPNEDKRSQRVMAILRIHTCVACGIRYPATRCDSLSCSVTCRVRLHRRKVKAIDLYRERQEARYRDVIEQDRRDRYGSVIGDVLNWIRAA
jgi:hypothetical protein